jgi:large subunit ribosomal protein L35
MKIRKALADRFRVTKTGKVLRRSSFGSHLKSAKSKSQIRRLQQTKKLQTAVAHKIKRLMGE